MKTRPQCKRCGMYWKVDFYFKGIPFHSPNCKCDEGWKRKGDDMSEITFGPFEMTLSSTQRMVLDLKQQLASVQAENKMLRDNTAMRINGTDEIERLQAELEGCKSNKLLAYRARDEQLNRAEAAERERDELKNTNAYLEDELRDVQIHNTKLIKERDELREQLIRNKHQAEYSNLEDKSNEWLIEHIQWLHEDCDMRHGGLTEENERYRKALERIANGGNPQDFDRWITVTGLAADALEGK